MEVNPPPLNDVSTIVEAKPNRAKFIPYPWGFLVIPATLALAVAMAKFVWIPLILG